MADPRGPQGSPCDTVENASGIHGKAPESNALPRRCKTLGALFSSASAQDLRAVDTVKEIGDRTSPRGVLEVCKNSTGSEAGSAEKGSPECETLCTGSKPLSHWRNFVKQWKKRSLKRLQTFPLVVPKIPIRLCKRGGVTIQDDLDPHVDANLCNFKSSWKIFSISDLHAATNNFSQENFIGRGSFAEVYKGCLRDGQLVAIKRLTRGTHEEKAANFLSELGIMAHVDHPNAAKLIGYGVDGGMHLVLQLSLLGSLASILNGSREKLDWSMRYKIALGTAEGLRYLHESCQRRIIHRDIKADNVLLTENYEPQICDFGLAMWLPRQCTHHIVFKFEGTFGYFAPEYLMHGIVDEKIDIYSFGVLLLELISGRRALDSSKQSILIWAKPLLRNNDLNELIDPCLGDNYDKEELDRMVLTASLCVQYTPILRPRMNQAVVLLRGEEYANGDQQRSMQRTYSKDLLDVKEYNSTKYMNNIGQHRQLAFTS
ncbi:hypothetical protein Nepgr_012293 [Nepenthes gracilis]|uniref:non-specific serine/threonine protein kinase n=1 Tax=Nepenthes gracilis TaxID=150966 RepID=A0AAD3XMP1_NEPGR|nr:hypothetical protein Nepgr_012293 [Nepenthes gracilis]